MSTFDDGLSRVWSFEQSSECCVHVLKSFCYCFFIFNFTLEEEKFHCKCYVLTHSSTRLAGRFTNYIETEKNAVYTCLAEQFHTVIGFLTLKNNIFRIKEKKHRHPRTSLA